MRHKIRYLLFRIHTTVVFHIAWMDERLRGADAFTASNDVEVVSSGDGSDEGDGYPFIYEDDDEVLKVEVRGGDKDNDFNVHTNRFETEEEADRVIAKVNEAIAEWARQPVVDNVDPAMSDCGPVGFPYNLV